MKIFLSHSSSQMGFVKDLHVELEMAGFRTFLDSQSLRASERWRDRIREEAANCEVAMFVLTEDFVTSEFPMFELCLFVERASKTLLLPLFYQRSDTDFNWSEKDLRWEENIVSWSRSWQPPYFSEESPGINECRTALQTLNKVKGFVFDRSKGQRCFFKSIVSRMEHLRREMDGVSGNVVSCVGPQRYGERSKREDGSMKIFISHCSEDKGFVKDLKYELERADWDTFCDIDIEAGEQRLDRVRSEVNICGVAMFVISEEFVMSEFAMLQLCLFLDRASNKKLIPLFYRLSHKKLRWSDNIEEWSKLWKPPYFSGEAPKADKCCKALLAITEHNGFSFEKNKGERHFIESIVSETKSWPKVSKSAALKEHVTASMSS